MKELLKLIRETPNKGKKHIFLGHPLSDGCDKTTVEPGNNFSPGVWTCGISIWIEVDNEFYSPDILSDEEIKWGFAENGFPPVLYSKYNASKKLSIENQLTYLGGTGAQGIDFNQISITATAETDFSLYIVVRETGPAGGRIKALDWKADQNTLSINQGIKLKVEKLPVETIIIKKGEAESPLALLSYPVHLEDKEIFTLNLKTKHGFDLLPFGNVDRENEYHNLSVQTGFKISQQNWEKSLPVKISAPDKRIGQVWEHCIFHILSAMECGLPRISAVDYPVFWIRDGVIVLRALDLIGRHDLARIGNDYLASLYFGGGFGAESDAPGEGIWSLSSHARITNDLNWLAKVFPQIEERVKWLYKMITTKSPVRMVTENRKPIELGNPGINILCLSAKKGLIHGRMDWHSPDFYINCWAECGLRLAADAAWSLGEISLAEEWKQTAADLAARIEKYLLSDYGSNPRDVIVTPYPSLTNQHFSIEGNDLLQKRFRKWYLSKRLTTEMKRRPEKLWTYFEAAQIHNAILLGFKELAWINLNGMLSEDKHWDVSAFIEGKPGGNESLSFRNDYKAKGWLNPKEAYGGNMPHNWTSGEIINLIRDIFVMETDEGLIIGRGIPREWLEPGKSFGVENMPTDYGKVTYQVQIKKNGEMKIDYQGPEKYKIDFKK